MDGAAWGLENLPKKTCEGEVFDWLSNQKEFFDFVVINSFMLFKKMKISWKEIEILKLNDSIALRMVRICFSFTI